jgi:hypothetical protein
MLAALKVDLGEGEFTVLNEMEFLGYLTTEPEGLRDFKLQPLFHREYTFEDAAAVHDQVIQRS